MIKIGIGILGAVIIIWGGYLLLRGSGPGTPLSPATPQAAVTEVSTPPAAPSTPTTTTSVATTNQTKKIMQATLHTNKGDITIEFATEQTPKTVANFVKLAQEGFYNGTKFHRVIKDFMIQGGDPLSKDDRAQAQWGTGGPGYKFNDEIAATNSNAVGTIAMANAGPNTNGSQFFINVADNSFLNTKHTVFGRVTKGMDIVNVISATPTGANDRPQQPITITSITLK